jgi:hypothetical protein
MRGLEPAVVGLIHGAGLWIPLKDPEADALTPKVEPCP